MRGLDPLVSKGMDCQVKPGNDGQYLKTMTVFCVTGRLDCDRQRVKFKVRSRSILGDSTGP